MIASGLIKKVGCYDYFIDIKNKNSYVISQVKVNKQYRGKNYQCDLVNELIKNNIDTIDEANIYAVVYVNNYASLRNMQKLGFEIVKEIQILRAFRKSINKERI